MLVDANLLIYAHVPNMPHHEQSREWLGEQLSTTRVAIPWPNLFALVRVLSHPKVSARPLHVDQAWALADRLIQRSNVWSPEPLPGHGAVVGRLLHTAGVGGNLVYDAHLGALAVMHGLTVFTNDSDFGRFREVQWRNPLSDTYRTD